MEHWYLPALGNYLGSYAACPAADVAGVLPHVTDSHARPRWPTRSVLTFDVFFEADHAASPFLVRCVAVGVFIYWKFVVGLDVSRLPRFKAPIPQVS